MSIKETEDLWRLYRREWVTVHTIDVVVDAEEEYEPRGLRAFELAREWIAENLEGRVRDLDIQIQLNTDSKSAFWAHVQVFKDNLKGEFKHFSTAEIHAQRNNYEEYVIVARDAPADHDVRGYGVKKL